MMMMMMMMMMMTALGTAVFGRGLAFSVAIVFGALLNILYGWAHCTLCTSCMCFVPLVLWPCIHGTTFVVHRDRCGGHALDFHLAHGEQQELGGGGGGGEIDAEAALTRLMAKSSTKSMNPGHSFVEMSGLTSFAKM